MSSKQGSAHQGTEKKVDCSITDDLSNLSLAETTPARATMATTCEDTSSPMRGDLEPAEHGVEVGETCSQGEVVPAKDTCSTPEQKQASSVVTCGVWKVTLRTVAVFEHEGHKAWVCSTYTWGGGGGCYVHVVVG